MGCRQGGGIGRSVSRPSDRTRYGGSLFAAASALPLDGGLGEPRRLVGLLLAAATRPSRAIALLTLLLRSPKVDVVLSDSAAGHALRVHLDQRFLGIVPQNRLCQGVLILPGRESDYLRGRKRQAARTNLRRAAAAGIRCETVSGRSDALQATAQIMQGKTRMTEEDRVTLTQTYRALFDLPEVTAFIARASDASPLAVAAVVIDDEMCLIRATVASNHEARWALHHHLVRTLIGRRVRFLVSALEGTFGALGLEPALQYYQHLLGYDLCHINPGVPPAIAARRAMLIRARAGSGRLR